MLTGTRSMLLKLIAALSLPIMACGTVIYRTDTGAELRVAYPSMVDVDDVPSLMADQLLTERGYTVTATFYAQSELAIMALARGDADIMKGGARNVWQAVSQGAKLATVMEHAANNWVMLTVSEIRNCQDLQGRRFAQHSEGTMDRALLDAYLLQECPGTEPEILVIPGSANRAAALLVGEVDAAGVKIPEAVEIELQAPGRFHILANFALDLPMLKASFVSVNRDFAARHPEAVRDYIRAVLMVHRRIAADPDLLIPEFTKWLALDPAAVPAILEAQFAVNTWDISGGMDEESIRFSIDFFTRAGRLTPGLTAPQVADLSYLNQVLGEMEEKKGTE